MRRTSQGQKKPRKLSLHQCIVAHRVESRKKVSDPFKKTWLIKSVESKLKADKLETIS